MFKLLSKEYLLFSTNIHRFLKLLLIKYTVFTPQKTVNTVYQILSDLTQIFEKNAINYWLSYGSLLGAVKYKGLIPWDDDIDICILFKDEQGFLSLNTELERLGYAFITTSFGYRIFLQNSTKRFDMDLKTMINTGYPYADIIVMDIYNDKVHHHREFYRNSLEWQKHFYYVTELYPLTKYSFGTLEILGPNNPLPFLTRRYGCKWSYGARIWLNHHSSTNNKQIFELTPEEVSALKPALPK